MSETPGKVVIMGGTHGDDALGVRVLTHYFQHNNPLFQLMLGNYKAIEQGVKFVDFDLMQAGKGDILCTTSIEKCRAAEIHEVLEQYDYVIDIHGSHVTDDCAIITRVDDETVRVVKALGITKAILVPSSNYLVESVKHNITLVKKVEARPAPTPGEVADTILMLDRLSEYFEGVTPSSKLKLYRLEGGEGNLMDCIINNDVSENLKEL
jgi:hypothetical protein